MKRMNKLWVALCLALALCLGATAALPAGLNVVTSAQAASSVKLNKTKVAVVVGGTAQLKVSGTKKTVTWSSSDKAVATVSKKGLVTAKKAGKATVTAKVGSKKLKCTVVVKASPVASGSVKIAAGKTKKVALYWPRTEGVTVSVSNSLVAKCTIVKGSLDNYALQIKGLAAGKATITVTNTRTKKKAKVKVTVTGGQQDDTPIVDKTAVTVKKGGTAVVKVTWKDMNEMPWLQYDSYIVEVKWGAHDGTGWPITIKGLAQGETDLVLTRGEEGDEVARVRVTVK